MGLYQILRCFVLFVFFAENHTVFSSFTSTPKDITPTKTKILVLKCLPSTEGLTAILAINIKKKEAVSDSSSDPGQPYGDNPHKEGQSSTFDSFVRAAISSGNRITVTPTSVRFKAEGMLGEDPSLTVTLHDPGVNDLGLYECQVTYFDENMNVKVFADTLEVRQEMELSVETLESRVQTLEGKFPVIMMLAEAMQQAAIEAKSADETLKQDVTSLRQENKQILETIAALSRDIQSLTVRIEASDKNQAEAATRVNNEDLMRVRQRMEDLENTRIRVLEDRMDDIRSKEGSLEVRADKLWFNLNVTMEERVSKLEKINWSSFVQRLDMLDLKTIPVLQNNVSFVLESLVAMEKTIDWVIATTNLSISELNSVLQSSAITSPGPLIATTAETEDQTTISGNACYVCGDNSTQSYCNARTSKHIAPCNDDQPYCVTDVYQNGAFRRVYKRCATLVECQQAVSMNDPQCADDTFILPIILRCHFCCTKPACNDYIRPSSDLYEEPPTK